jgi:hypothetical protein
MNTNLLSVTAIAATSLLPIVAGAQSATSAQSLEGAYRGMFVCEKVQTSPDILRVPVDLKISNGNVQFARPVFNWNGQRVVGSELGSGTVDADGKLHLASDWTFRGITYRGDYNGTLTASGGTLSGTQSWSAPQVNGSRTCTAAVVPAPKGQHAAAQP